MIRVLVIAPQPFYQERGTPIAVDMLVRALTGQGKRVDLLTYPHGETRNYEGLKIVRARCWPNLGAVSPGISLKKLYLDIWLFFALVWLMVTRRYDVVHAVEESALMVWLLRPFFRGRFVYDMDSSMVTQMMDRYPNLHRMEKPLRFLESLPMRHADAVVACCQALGEQAGRYRSGGIHVITDVSHIDHQSGREDCSPPETDDDNTILMYIGNLEPYQGIDLLLESYALASSRSAALEKPLKLMIVGGEPEDVRLYQRKAAGLGITSIDFLGHQPLNQLGSFMQRADILVSPRISGVNTPMKMYSYLDSGKAVLATDLPTHTQVMTPESGYLVEPEPEALASGILSLASDPVLRCQLGRNGKALVSREYTAAAFERKVGELYDSLLPLVSRSVTSS